MTTKGRRPRTNRTFPARPAHSCWRRLPAALAALALCGSTLTGCGSLPWAGTDDSPVTVMTWAPQDTGADDQPGMPAMAQAYARWANAHGGIAGHPLRVLTCNDHNDTVQAAACADRAVKAGAVAVVGSYSQYGRSYMSALEQAGIPYLGGYGVADEEFSSPLSYPVNGGMPALAAGNGRQLRAAGCTRAALVRPDTIAGDTLPPLVDAGLHRKQPGDPRQDRKLTDIRAPEGATDYTKDAQRALDTARGAFGNADGGGCVTAELGGRTGTFYDSFRRLPDQPGSNGNPGARVRTASVLGSVTQSLVDRTGGSAGPLEGAYTTGWYPAPSDPRWAPMKQVIADYAFHDNRIDSDDPGVQTTWIGYTVLRHVLERLKGQEVTAKSVRQQLDYGRPVSTGGLTPKLDWSYQNMLAARDFPRIVNTTVTYQRVRDGRLTAVRKGFVDVESILSNDPDAQ